MKNAELWFDGHEDELVRDLCGLVRIPSVSRKTDDPACPYGEECRDVLEQMLEIGRRDGFQGYNHENRCGSLVFRGQGTGAQEKTIGIFGHLDVVEAGEGWRHPPFEPVVKDGIISGRGAADDKGSLLSAYYALKYLKSAGYEPGASIIFFLGLNEEKEMEDIDFYLAAHREPDFSIVTDSFFPVCIGEKGMMRLKLKAHWRGTQIRRFCAGTSENAVPGTAVLELCTDRDGYLRLVKAGMAAEEGSEEPRGETVTICCHGKSAHAAFPEDSDNAMVKLAKCLLDADVVQGTDRELLVMIAELFADCYGSGLGIRQSDPVFGDTTAVGTVFSYDGEVVEIAVNIRYGTGLSSAEIDARVRERAGGRGFSVERCACAEPFYRDMKKDTPGIIRAINGIACRHLGIQREPYVLSGGTYAKKLQRGVGFGPDYQMRRHLLPDGYGGGHQPDEYMEIQDIKKAFLIYVESLQEIDRRLAGRAPAIPVLI